MKVPLKWLRDYVAVDLSPTELAAKLTMAGVEAKSIETVGSRWENIVIAQVVAVDPHPNADRLHLTTVDLGGERQTVVCGAPNLNIGDKVVFARLGAGLIDPDTGKTMKLKAARIRGVKSEGMVCSEKELGISDNHEGIMVLPADAPVGTPLSDYLGDTVFDLEVTPNRPDCLSVIGLAREVAALTGKKVRLPEMAYEETVPPISEKVAVEILAPDLCPRYCASLITGLKLAPSPKWLQERLIAGGMRPINNLVDVTNYVMLEYGQPLHAFNYDQVSDGKIIVRRAAQGEKMVSLDGVTRTLDGEMLVIADPERAVAIGGVMGGANSEVTEATTSILLEAASFNAASIHRTGRLLGLPSEACYRFERGIRPEMALPALRRATRLLVELGGGTVAAGVIDEYPGRVKRVPIRLSGQRLGRLLGVDFSLDRITSVLTSLGFRCQPADSAGEILVSVPEWRGDISLEVDLIEEAARVIGYDEIPTTMLAWPLPKQNPAPIINLKKEVNLSLTGGGFQEIITYSTVGLEALEKLSAVPRPVSLPLVHLANPMSADQEYLRPTLRPNLLAALAANMRFEEGGIRLFELGRVYLTGENGLPGEPEMVCGVLSGLRRERMWHGGEGTVDFFDAKGVVEFLLACLGVDASFENSEDESLHPAQQAAITVGGRRLGVVGEVHPRVARAFDIPRPVYLFEVDLTVLLPFTLGGKMFQPIPRFPAIIRDVALIVDAGVTHRQVREIISSFPLVRRVSLFDVYSGKQVMPGKRSLAYRVSFQSLSHTLTDSEVDDVFKRVLHKLSGELGATRRG